MKKICLALFMLLSMLTVSARGQEAPAPRRMPRTAVSREALITPRDAMPSSHQLQGLAAILDGEKLRIGDTDLRLFGIVPPQLAASFGPQARAALDTLANGLTVSCQIRDRDRDGRLLATCRNSANADMALELLKHGLAVTARGSIAGTDVAVGYLAAEQTAQNGKLGLWSVTAATPSPQSNVAVLAAKAELLPASSETEPKKEEKLPPHSDKASADAQIQAKIAADVTAQQKQIRLDDTAWTPDESVGFFERYQILIACALMLATALSIIGALWGQKRRDRMDELKSIAAALRGELMAARSICAGRAKAITDDAQDRAATWPRIRATLYQAYVGRLGILGAELARRVASIYGQSGDYASLYSPTSASQDGPKKQALETLARHIDDVLPVLAEIERSGFLPPTPVYRTQGRLSPSTVKPLGQMLPRAIAPDRIIPQMSVDQRSQPALSDEPTIGVIAEDIDPDALPSAAPVASTRSPIALWENVRGFLQGHTGNTTREAPQITDPHVNEYAAMIEADMARYQYGESEPLDIVPQKKSG